MALTRQDGRRVMKMRAGLHWVIVVFICKEMKLVLVTCASRCDVRLCTTVHFIFNENLRSTNLSARYYVMVRWTFPSAIKTDCCRRTLRAGLRTSGRNILPWWYSGCRPRRREASAADGIVNVHGLSHRIPNNARRSLVERVTKMLSCREALNKISIWRELGISG
jgi:hypothetical protein